jgi:acyl-CoA thioester hydrolase
MGVAHHASYLVWFEAGRTEFIRERGRSYAQIEAGGWLLVVVEARCRYLRPARYDDVLVIRTHLASLAPASLEFGYEVIRKADSTVLARGTTVHAAVDRTGRPRRIPEDIRRLLGELGMVPPPRPGPAARGPTPRPPKGRKEPGRPAN